MAPASRYQLLRQLSSASPNQSIIRKGSTSTQNTTTIMEQSTSLPSGITSSSLRNTNHETLRKDRLNSLIQKMENNARRTIELRLRMAEDRDRLSKLGSMQTTLQPAKPSHFRAHPTPISDLTLATLITATTHLGHNKSLTCPTNFPLVYGTRSDVAIIDLRQTLNYLRRACNVIRETVLNDGIVLFSNGVPGTEMAIKRASERLGENGYSLGIRPNGKGASWVRGTLTNATEVLKRPRQVAKQLRLATGSMHEPPTQRKQQADHLESLKFLPSLIVLFNPRESRVLIREAALKQIPTIGVIDTDVDPRVVTYPIPANDDSIRSIELLAGVLSMAGQDGFKRRTQLLSSKFSGSDSM